MSDLPPLKVRSLHHRQTCHKNFLIIGIWSPRATESFGEVIENDKKSFHSEVELEECKIEIGDLNTVNTLQ